MVMGDKPLMSFSFFPCPRVLGWRKITDNLRVWYRLRCVPASPGGPNVDRRSPAFRYTVLLLAWSLAGPWVIAPQVSETAPSPVAAADRPAPKRLTRTGRPSRVPTCPQVVFVKAAEEEDNDSGPPGSDLGSPDTTPDLYTHLPTPTRPEPVPGRRRVPPPPIVRLRC
jgi:hypothetical protein